MDKPKLAIADPEPTVTISKPVGFDLDRFKSKRAGLLANVETLLPPLPIHKIGDANDFVRLHHNEDAYWSPELCFVNVPVVGQKKDTKHLIEEELAMQYLPSKLILRHRLALASKPYNKFFLCVVPSGNLDNVWNETSFRGCVMAKSSWVMVSSRAAEMLEGYAITHPREATAFDDPQWPSQSLNDLIVTAFNGRIIDNAEHAGFLRLIGAAQQT
jgi:hypothetical protein